MERREIVVVAASAGGIEALTRMLGRVSPTISATILVVVHIPAEASNTLARTLDRAGPLPATTVLDGERLEPGRVLVCAADHHMTVAGDHLHVRRGPREHGHRPAADPLFRSAARYHGRRVIGVILSGTLSDGTAGLRTIRRHGGLAIVQEPGDALYEGMPRSALEYVGADLVGTADEIGSLLGELTAEPLPPSVEREWADPALGAEVSVMEGQRLGPAPTGTPCQWPCPDCGGVL
jgi:two-component system chemotaxis response regulator CheB